MFNFIDYLLEYTKQAESPTEFWRWAGLAGLNAIIRDNIYLETSIVGTVYPNMYVILLSDSGIARKAAPCKFIGRLIQTIGNTKFVSGRSSMQAVVKELGTTYTNESGTMVSGSAGLLYSEELSSFVVQDPATIPLLIDLYDYHEIWKSNLISGSTRLRNVCVSLLAASNSDLFKSVYTDQAIKGGLLGRTLIVKEDKARHRKSLFDLNHSSLSVDPLLHHLVKLSRIKGAITVTEEAKKEYNDWYYSVPENVFEDKIGFGSRLGTHVFKVALALGAAREDFERMLTINDIQRSIELCLSLRKNYKQLTLVTGLSNLTAQTAIIIKLIASESNHHISRIKLIQRTLGDVELEQLDKILELLIQGNLLKVEGKNMEPGYKLTQEGIEKLLGV